MRRAAFVIVFAAGLIAQDEALLMRARTLVAQGDLTSAENALFEYIRVKPRDPSGYGELAQVLLTKGDYRRAGNFATAALSYKADYPEALVVQGQLYGMQGRTTEAEELLKKASDLDPNNAEAHFQLGTLFDRTKRSADAVIQFEKVVALRPDDPRGWDYLALSLEPLGQMEKADTAYRKGLAVNKGSLVDSFLDYNYGRFLMKQNRLAESKSHLDRAVRLAPATRAVHFERGKLNLLLKNYKEARTDAERSLALADPSGVILDGQVYYLLTTIYQRLGEDTLARKYAELSRTTKRR
jgi:protein O-GlcNAc transferase